MFIEGAGLDAVGDGALAIHFDLDLRDGDLGFEVDVGEAGDGLGEVADLGAFFAEDLEIGAEDFDGDFGGDAAEHVGEAMADGLADIDEGAGDGLEFGADVSEDDFPGSAGVVEFDIELIDADGHDVVVFFSATSTAADAFDFGNALEEADANFADFVGVGEGGAGGADEGDGGAAFVESGQELFAHEGIEHDGGDEQDAGEGDDEDGGVQSDAEEGAFDDPLHGADEEAIGRMVRGGFGFEEDGAKDGDDGE